MLKLGFSGQIIARNCFEKNHFNGDGGHTLTSYIIYNRNPCAHNWIKLLMNFVYGNGR